MTINASSPILRVSSKMPTDPEMPAWNVDHIKSYDLRVIHYVLCDGLAGELQNLKQSGFQFVPSPTENTAIIFNTVVDDINYPVLLYTEFDRIFQVRPMFNGMFFFLDQYNELIDGDLPPKQSGHIFMTMDALSLAGQEFAELSVEAFATIEMDRYQVVFDVL